MALNGKKQFVRPISVVPRWGTLSAMFWNQDPVANKKSFFSCHMMDKIEFQYYEKRDFPFLMVIWGPVV